MGDIEGPLLEEGSSPLTRGKPSSRRSAATSSGLIPAHAGKTTCGTSQSTVGRAHPRSRGENTGRESGTASSKGSSPLTRGKRGRTASIRRACGLIPAHAGKTDGGAPALVSGGAHPRSRGENWNGAHHIRKIQGSSPLTRGKRWPTASFGVDQGLIPAHAGKT